MRFILSFFAIALSGFLCAQAPALIPYQAIARDASGQPLANATLNARFTIHDNTATGPTMWQEMQTVSTSALGLFTAQLGSSVSLGNVNWAAGAKFMQVEIDLGNGFIDLGTQQMLSVPYALYSRSVKLNVSSVGDTLFVGDGSFVIVPGISAANDFGGNGTTGTTLHTCGVPNVHNPDLTYGTMTDQQGNTYKTIVIGTQEWMAENLNTSIYRNGDTIPIGLNVSDWANSINIQLGVSAFYDNDSIYACPHGRLYSWFVCVDSRQLCPSGWHVPNDEEWEIIVSYLGGEDMAGNMMKTSSEIYWSGESVTGSNESGFSGTAAGRRFYEGFDDSYGEYAYWWSISESATNFSWSRSVSSSNSTIDHLSQYKHSGLSVRCLRD